MNLKGLVSVGVLVVWFTMVQVDNFQAMVSNRYHMTFLLNTIDFDSKATRRAVETREIPIYLSPSFQNDKNDLTGVGQELEGVKGLRAKGLKDSGLSRVQSQNVGCLRSLGFRV